MKKLLFILLLVTAPIAAWAQATTTIPNESPSLYRGVRQLGMGNAAIAMPGTDEAAPFYNPAAIHDYQGFHMRLVSPAADLSTSTVSLAKDIFDLADQINAAATTKGKTDTFETFVNKHTGEFHTLDVRLPIITAMSKYFFISTLADSRNTFSFRNRVFRNVEILSRSDLGGMVGTAYGFFDDQLEAGLDVKVLHRVLIDRVLTTNDIIATSSFGDALALKRGTGVGFDLGLKGKIPTFDIKTLDLLKPTAGFTWQDVGNTRFGDAGQTDQSISLGVAVHPTFQLKEKDWQNHFAMDLRDLNQPEPFTSKLYFGYELMAPRFFIVRPSIRIGANQFYIAGGTTLDFRFFKVEFAVYQQETGKFTRQDGQTRIAANIALGF